MSTILTDDEIATLMPNDDTPMSLGEAFYTQARAVEAAVLAKLERQADRQRVPEGYVLVPVQPTQEMVQAAIDEICRPLPLWKRAEFACRAAMLAAAPEAPANVRDASWGTGLGLAVIGRRHFGNPIPQQWYAAARELLDHAAPEAPAQADHFEQHLDMVPAQHREPSPTAGMNMAQRILHVGGRTNAAGYVEFGSVQAVDALVRHVLRDLPDAAPAQAPSLTLNNDQMGALLVQKFVTEAPAQEGGST